MNQLVKTFNTSELTMTSREIAELTGKRHDNILRDIRAMLTDIHGEGGLLKFEGTYIHPQNGNEYTEYRLPKDETICLLTGYDAKARFNVVKRWQELEAQKAFKIPQTLAEALRLSADLADKVQEQQALIEHQKPAVEFVERYVETRSSRSLREAAKLLDIKERDFIKRLLDEHILFRQSGNILPYATYQHKGYFTLKTGESNGYAYQQTRFTPEGINWISKRFGLIKGAA